MAATGPRNLITDVPGILVGQAEDRAGDHRHDGDAGRGAGGRRGRCARRRAGQPRDRAARTRRRWSSGSMRSCCRAARPSGSTPPAGSMEWLAATGPRLSRCATCGCRSCRRRSCSTSAFPAGAPGPAQPPLPPARPRGRGARGGQDFALGNAGAGLGAKAGRLKGGLGSASLRLADGAHGRRDRRGQQRWGSVVRPDCGRLWAAELALPGEIPPQPAIPAAPLDPEDFSACGAWAAGANTTIAVVATDAPLDKSGCRRLAMMAQDGLARAIRPAHTPFDGDTVFALSTGERRRDRSAPPGAARQPPRPTAWRARSCGRWSPPSRSAAYPSWRQRWGGRQPAIRPRQARAERLAHRGRRRRGRAGR